MSPPFLPSFSPQVPLEGDPLQGEGKSGLWKKGEEKEEEEALTEEGHKRRILFCAVCLTVFLRQVSKLPVL